MSQRFTVLEGRFAICRLAPDKPLPEAPPHAVFWSLTRTAEEISIVCDEACAPKCDSVERVWRGIKVEGPIDFDLTGVICSLITPLAALELGVFVVSTYDTDYVFVKELDLAAALSALSAAGHTRLA